MHQLLEHMSVIVKAKLKCLQVTLHKLSLHLSLHYVGHDYFIVINLQGILISTFQLLHRKSLE